MEMFSKKVTFKEELASQVRVERSMSSVTIVSGFPIVSSSLCLHSVACCTPLSMEFSRRRYHVVAIFQGSWWRRMVVIRPSVEEIDGCTTRSLREKRLTPGSVSQNRNFT